MIILIIKSSSSRSNKETNKVEKEYHREVKDWIEKQQKATSCSNLCENKICKEKQDRLKETAMTQI